MTVAHIRGPGPCLLNADASALTWLGSQRAEQWSFCGQSEPRFGGGEVRWTFYIHNKQNATKIVMLFALVPKHT